MKFTTSWIGKLLGFKTKEEEIEDTTQEAVINRLESTTSDEELKDIIVENLVTPELEKELEPKPHPTIMLVNGALTVILDDGTEFYIDKGNKELVFKIQAASTRREIEYLMCEPSKIEQKVELEQLEEQNKESKQEAIIHDQKIDKVLFALSENDEFEIKDDHAYIKGLDRALPKLLAIKFSKLKKEDNEYIALKRFWFWCVSNPIPEVANLLYGFLEKNVLRLNIQGFFYALRNVVSVETEKQDKALIDAITNGYVKIKAWKKSPKNFDLWQNFDTKEYTIKKIDVNMDEEETYTLIGNLEDLYKNIGDNEENRYTDDYTRTFDIRVGKLVSMPREECAFSIADCAKAGLHFTLNEVNYVGCGDTAMLVLINPMKIVGIGDTKGRCYEYLPVMTVAREEANTLLRDKDFDTLALDEWYAEEEIENLEAKITSSYVQEANKPSLYKKASITEGEVRFLVDNLSKVKSELSNRVVKV